MTQVADTTPQSFGSADILQSSTAFAASSGSMSATSRPVSQGGSTSSISPLQFSSKGSPPLGVGTSTAFGFWFGSQSSQSPSSGVNPSPSTSSVGPPGVHVVMPPVPLPPTPPSIDRPPMPVLPAGPAPPVAALLTSL